MIDSCYVGDVREGLRAMIEAGVRAQTCVTSPPYWGLRDYGTAEWEGGDPECSHTRPATGGNAEQGANKGNNGENGTPFRELCRLCGARRIDRQIGLEPTIAEYVATMVEVFRLVRDVLADDGTLWLNLGDSYAGSWGAQSRPQTTLHDSLSARQIEAHPKGQTNTGTISDPGLKPKDLCGIPWRVALALQADGWYLRSDIIWSKPNPMPESVTDRCTKAHEYLFLMSKRERYYYDAEAIREESKIAEHGRYDMAKNGVVVRTGRAYLGQGLQDNSVKVRSPAGWKTGNGSHGSIHADGREQEITYKEIDATTRNRRTVWEIATEPYPDAHFATFPTALVEPCILAGSRPGDVVLDPFMGSGTVAKVAQSLGRRWVGCELNPDYVAMQRTRTAQLGMELA